MRPEPDPQAYPDVLISGRLADEIRDILRWAEHRVTPSEGVALGQIRHARGVLDMECITSWYRHEREVGGAA